MSDGHFLEKPNLRDWVIISLALGVAHLDTKTADPDSSRH